jgi:hypothetical protein
MLASFLSNDEPRTHASLVAQSKTARIISKTCREAVTLTENQDYHDRAKHFDINLQWIRDRRKSREPAIRFTLTDANLTAPFTKPPPTTRHKQLTSTIG